MVIQAIVHASTRDMPVVPPDWIRVIGTTVGCSGDSVGTAVWENQYDDASFTIEG